MSITSCARFTAVPRDSVARVTNPKLSNVRDWVTLVLGLPGVCLPLLFRSACMKSRADLNVTSVDGAALIGGLNL